LTKDIKNYEKNLKALKTKLAQMKEETLSKRNEVQTLEKALLEKEFELREIENEKAIRSQDAKLN